MSSKSNEILQTIYRQGDVLMHWLACAMWLAALAIAIIVKSSLAPIFAIGLPAVALATWLRFAALGSLASRLGMSAVMMVLVAVQIQAAQGMSEMHFGVFVLLAFLLYYRDWRPIACAASVIAIHHVAFDLLQAQQTGVLVFERRNGFNIVVLHALYVVFEAGVLIFLAKLLRQEAIASQAVVDMARAMGQGQFNYQIDSSLKEETIAVLGPLKEMQSRLHAVFEDIRGQSQALAQSTQELDSSASTMAANAQTQSDSASTMAIAIEQLTSSITQLADQAKEAAAVSQESGALSQQGSSIIREATREIGEISATIQQTAATIEQLGRQSEKISSIVHVIKEVAEQTNLLALNAAIEAARAGEQGRGFAVVADEVRKLAERTTQSTQEISAMVQSIHDQTASAVEQMQTAVQRVNHGVQLTEQTGAAIVKIAAGASRTLSLIHDISQTLHEQSATSREVALRVEAVAQSSSINSETAEVSASAVHRLDELASQMQHSIKRFQFR